MTKKKKILIFGSTGKLGSEFVRQFKKLGYSLVLPKKNKCDVTKKADVSKIITNKYDLVINCTGISNIDFCQTNKQKAINLNILAPYYMALACLEHEIEFMHIGSTVDQEITNIYAFTKKVSSEIPKSLDMKKYYVFKTDILFGKTGQKHENFVEYILSVLDKNKKIGVTNNRWSSPTYSKDLVKLCIEYYKKKKYGVYEATNQGRVTRWELANEIAKIVGKKPNFYIDNKYKDIAPRCRDSSSKSKLLRPYKKALKEYIHESYF
ncbi:sugar nucleotide-binding protein [Patescibacteria group bacterium]|nr:sugar nucleotide-binding protein [Patescibacteria group bacterium]